MARRNHRGRQRADDDDVVVPLTIAPPTFPLPAGAHAWQDWCTRRELRRRLYRCLRRLGWLVGGYVAATLVSGAASALLPAGAADPVIGLLVLVMMAGVPLLIAGGFGVLGVVRMWFFLIRYPWRAYECRHVNVGGDGRVDAVRVTVTDPDSADARRYLKVWANRRRQTLRGMPVPEVWVAGSLRRGVLVMAGGGELFLFRRDRAWERSFARYAARPAQPSNRRRAAKAAKPAKPPKVRQLSPKQQAKAEQRARARARAAAAATARLNRTYAARAARTRQRGPLPLLRLLRLLEPRGRRLLGGERGGGIFTRK